MNITKNTTFVAKTYYGLEDILAREIQELGVKNTEILNRAVKFKGDKKLLYKANIFLRTAIRILIPVEEFHATSYDELYKRAIEIDWDRYFTPYHTFFINSSVYSKKMDHSYYASLKLKDAIVDYFRSKYNLRPSVDKEDPDYRIDLHIYKDKCTISLNSSGESLHKRGYKVQNVKAPINETLAAGIILLSNWDKKSPFIDPMCGSGTFPIEAALIAYNIPPGTFRSNYGFTKWQNYDEDLHNNLIDKATNKKPEKKVKIMGTDILEESISKSKNNAQNAGLEKYIDFQISPFEEFPVDELSNGVVIMNPPYDMKLKKENINEFYKKIGNTLKQNFNGFDVWIFSGNLNAIKNVGLRPNKKITLFNGPIESKLLHYPIYQGTLKNKKFD